MTLREFEYNHSRIVLKSSPLVYQIELTNACTMKCIMCPRRLMTRPIGYMDEGCFKNIIDQIEGINTHVLLHHFGESLLHPKLYELLVYLKNKNIKSELSANPTELSQEKIEAICRGGLNELILSIDASTDSTYKSIRGAHADLDIAMKNIDNIIAYKKKFSLHNPVITVQLVKMKKNESEIGDFKRRWNIPGIGNILIKDFYLWSRSDESIRKEALLSKKVAFFPCAFPWLSVVILWDGRVVPCCNDYDGLYVLGDLKEKTLKAIWNDSSMLELRRQHIKNQSESNKLCFGCTVKIGHRPCRFYPFTLNLWFISRKSSS